jgi:hypothetical protein
LLTVNDCQHFVFSAEQWAVRAAEIGWTTESLFGCYWSRSLDHLGSAGLLWHLVGGRLVRLHRGLGRDRGGGWHGARFP